MMETRTPLRLGTRASPLAMAQAAMAKAALCAAHGWDDDRILLCPVTASGDRILDRALAEVGGKALWTKELDEALLDGRIDFAVHSMKDVETVRPDIFHIAGGGVALNAALAGFEVVIGPGKTVNAAVL